ncbi:MAG: choice-of-anchor L domain-containing protein [Bacteroidetes bacterium]|nr:choice-of-anchor L domain-containing protein [Bacteroidota bacterium]
MNKKLLLLVGLLIGFCRFVLAQLVVTNQGATASTIVTGFAGQGLIISNATISCPSNAYGTFSNGGTTNLGIASGILLTTGSASNTAFAAVNNSDISNGTSCNDPQLLTLDPAATFDCCVLEFDVVPQCSQVAIRFVFGSEEYPTYVNATFNDAFGFFISGPNPTGGSYTNYNIARIPSTSTIVSIDNINAITNSSYFVNNATGTTIVYNGFTTVLTQSISVIPCQTYHFKLAIADASDRWFDSGVFIDFLQCSNLMSLNMLSTPTACGNTNGTARVMVSNNTGPYTYTWSPMPTVGQGTDSISGLSPATYSVTVDDSYTCISPITGTVVVGSVATTTVSINSPTICVGQTTTLTATPSSGGGIYLWQPGGATTQSISVNPTTATNYTVSYTLFGCISSEVASVFVNPPPTVAVNSTSICAGQSAVLSATGATSYNWSTGATSTSIVISPSTSTNYTVTGTALGCSQQAITTVSVVPLPVVAVNSTSVCAGQSAVLSATGATSYNWSTGATSSSISISPSTSTNYTVTGTALGCSQQAIATVIVVPLPVVAVNSTSICTGQSATLSATGATSYNWSTGATSSSISISPSASSNYTVTGTTLGCSASTIGVVSITPLPIINVNSQAVCIGQSTTLSASGASSYLWSTSETTSTISVLPTATTSYTVTGAHLGCSDFAIATVTVSANPPVTASSALICAGQSAILSATGGNTYNWSTGASTSAISVSPSITTNYTVTGFLTGGCFTTVVATVSVVPLPIVTANSTSICSGQNAALTATGATSYVWNNASTTHVIIVAPTTTTSYTVTGTQAGCSATSVATVSVAPLPIVSVSSTTICAGQTAILSAAGATDYSWNTGATSSAINVSPSTTTSYTVVGAHVGCSATSTGTVFVEAVPSSTATTALQTICSGQNVNITLNSATIGTAFAWLVSQSNTIGASSGAGNLIQQQLYTTTTNLGTATYTIVPSANGCVGLPTILTITVNPTPVITTTGDTAVCSGNTVLLTANLLSNTTYNWVGPNGFTSSLQQNIFTNISTSASGVYTLTVADANNCFDTASVSIVVNALPVVTISSTSPVCEGGIIALSASGGANYSWTGINSFTSELSNPVIASATAADSGMYNVTASDSNGCVSTNTVLVIVNQKPLIALSANATSGCTPLCVTFSNTSVATNYVWNFGDGTTLTTSTTTQHCYNTSGLYDVALVATNAAGCSSSLIKQSFIDVFPSPTANFTATPGSASISNPHIQFTDGSINATWWKWDFGNTSNAQSSDQNPFYVYPDTGTYTIEFITGNQFGCTDTAYKEIYIFSDFTFYIPNSFTPNDDNLNDVFMPKLMGVLEGAYEFLVFDRWGNVIFRTTTTNIGWDGKIDGTDGAAQIDVYIWKINITDLFGIKHKLVGHVNVIK